MNEAYITTECSRTIERYGWYSEVTQDATICPNCGTLVYPNAKRGTFDVRVAIPRWNKRDMVWVAIELKYGRTRIPFDAIRDAQVKWAEEKQDDYLMWLWYGIGKDIRHKKYPRKTWLFPYRLLSKLKTQYDRKSIPFDCPQLDKFELQWEGYNTWSIPKKHLFWKEIEAWGKK